MKTIVQTLDNLGIKHLTDKSSMWHNYLHIYEPLFNSFKWKETRVHLLELGYGGHEDPNKGGESMRMWQEYAPKWIRSCIDIHNKENVNGCCNLFIGSQDDISLFEEIFSHNGNPDIVIDDASHISSLTIKSFELIFPYLQKGGLYCIEDTHSSLHSFYYGKDEANENPKENGEKSITAMNYFKDLVDSVNNDLMLPKYRSNFDIEFIHFYKDLIIVKKN